MKRIECYETEDGTLHRSYSEAKKFAEARYADQLSKMAHKLCQIDNYSEMMEALDGYKGSMQRLLDLSKDLRTCHEDEDEGTI